MPEPYRYEPVGVKEEIDQEILDEVFDEEGETLQYHRDLYTDDKGLIKSS